MKLTDGFSAILVCLILIGCGGSSGKEDIVEKDGCNCESFRYSTCPVECEKNCLPSVCDESSGICTADCDGPGSCSCRTE